MRLFGDFLLFSRRYLVFQHMQQHNLSVFFFLHMFLACRESAFYFIIQDQNYYQLSAALLFENLRSCGNTKLITLSSLGTSRNRDIASFTTPAALHMSSAFW